MERTRNNDTGRYDNHGRSPDDILTEMERGEIYSTQDLADKAGIPYRTTLRYLDELVDAGRIEKEMPNSRTAIWIRHE